MKQNYALLLRLQILFLKNITHPKMNILQQLVAGMNKEQIRFFKLFAGRTLTPDDRKDILLFDYIRKSGEQYKDEKIFQKLYSSDDKNAFYRLKHRLLSDLNKSFSIQHFEDDDFIYACHMLALYKYFADNNKLKEAEYYLKKAESGAKALENFELLDIIYGEYIRLSQETLHINPEGFIEQRKKNQQQIHEIRAIDDLLAVVTYRLKKTQNFSPEKNPLLDLLKKTTDDFVQDRDLKKSPMLRFRIYRAVSQVLLQRHDYKPLEQYLLNIYKDFEKEQLFNKNNHDTKLQMLTYIVNTLFKNNKLKQSLQYAELLRKAMEEYHHILYDKYFFFYYNSLVINYSVLDKDKAIELLEDLKDNEKIKSNSFYHMFVYINLATQWFDKKVFKEAIKNITRLYLLDGYKSADRSLKFKIAVSELIIRYELESFDVLEYKMAQVKKDYKDLLSKEEHLNEKDLLLILKDMVNLPQPFKNKILRNRIANFISRNKSVNEETEIISYTEWVSKLTKEFGTLNA